MKIQVVDTNFIRIYMAGDIETARRICREYCFKVGLCVTLTKTEYIYTGGAESGFIVELINYPRFPTTPDELLKKAKELSQVLMEANCQESFTIMTPVKTYWFTTRLP